MSTAAAQQSEPFDDDFVDEGEEYCHVCGNLGTINCFCGGDLCACENNGEIPCPNCG